MKVVLDTNAVIFLNDFRNFEEIFTVPEVMDEIKDRNTSMKLSGMNIKTREPDEKSVKEIKKMSSETGDSGKLSQTDVKILALAKEKNLTIVSNDFNIQNVAQKFGINYVSATDKKIKKVVIWRSYCENCEKFYDDQLHCSRCGGDLIRKRVSNISLS
ncbi:MAG: hypothetical protein HYW22_02160 [Candidatus Aenigmarchaeota archaeon]|nr:hypothetical protein [Candidatus Aenigmarchaeota archaeon]